MLIENDSYFQKKLQERNNSRISIEEIVDNVALDFVLYNSVMLLKTMQEDITIENLRTNPYFKNIYTYLMKQDFKYKYKTKISVEIPWNEISNQVNFINFDIILYTLKKLPNQLHIYIDEYISIVEKFIKGYKQQNELNKFSRPTTSEGKVNEDGTYAIDGTIYKNKEVYMSFLMDSSTENYGMMNGVIYPIEDIKNKIIK